MGFDLPPGVNDVDVCGARVAVAWDDGRIAVFDESGQAVASFRVPGPWPRVDLGAAGGLLAVSSNDGDHTELWDVDGGQVVQEWRAEWPQSVGVAVADDERSWVVLQDDVATWIRPDGAHILGAADGPRTAAGSASGAVWFPRGDALVLLSPDGAEHVLPTGGPSRGWSDGERVVVESYTGLWRIDLATGAAEPWSLPGWGLGAAIVRLLVLTGLGGEGLARFPLGGWVEDVASGESGAWAIAGGRLLWVGHGEVEVVAP